ncbi:MAG: ComF family protein [Acidobacteriota bacterium]|nr:ComF family protein [Acidobacteriota bacterium]NLT32353.1 ComF family protein [Acidobacteriota bacterium]
MEPTPRFLITRDLPDSAARKLLDGILNLVYPDACALCGAPVARSRECSVCAACWDLVLGLKIGPPCCTCCGLPLPGFDSDPAPLCLDCLDRLPPYAGARSWGHYAESLRGAIHALKFAGRQRMADGLAPLLAQAFLESWRREDFDAIAAVPLHPKRKLERGFNQSELLAVRLGRILGLPLVRALERTRPTPPQVGLGDADRWANVRGAFRCTRPRLVREKRILLVDDVMTTGATVGSATTALLAAGARRVSVLTAARAVL